MNISEITKKPVFLNRNRVGRIYTGGKLFAGFFGDEPVDGFLPEEWVCSAVEALNEGSDIENEGISTVRGTNILFSDLLKDYKEDMIGPRPDFPVLVKLLDSAIRLPIQAHPDRAYSEKYLNSSYGKAESWIVVDTREDACLYFGFKDKMTKEEFREAVAKSYDEPDYMQPLLNRVPVKKGDIYLVPAKMVHAIGAGCLILETQEPSDFTIQPEAWCAGNRISEHTMYLGLPEDIALDVFNFDIFGEEAVRRAKKEPRVIYERDGVKRETLISYDDTPCFAVNRVSVCASATDDLVAPAIYIVTEGEGEIVCGEESTPVKKGDYFFAPYSINGKFTVKSATQVELVECLPAKE
ncbi:MAG: class I mannose-6-phosphate isomerase [Clostridia bacterium]|nr:class I mannose-6-phosphate isomerase [Clostridia bacterium]